MAQYKTKSEPFEAMTFEEVVEFAKQNSPEPHWHFTILKSVFTHENDKKYLFNGVNGTIFEMTPDDMLVFNRDGDGHTKDKAEFDKRYERV